MTHNYGTIAKWNNVGFSNNIQPNSGRFLVSPVSRNFFKISPYNCILTLLLLSFFNITFILSFPGSLYSLDSSGNMFMDVPTSDDSPESLDHMVTDGVQEALMKTGCVTNHINKLYSMQTSYFCAE